MQATKGFDVRARGRVLGCAVAVAALAAMMFTQAAHATPIPQPEVTTYLALGDSISFGYSEEKFDVNFPNDAPAYFEGGFDNYFAADLKKTYKGITIVNDACPGETSGSLIGEEESPCAYQKAGLPLHNPYPGHSQLEAALSLLKGGHPAHPVEAVTLNIGSNDELAAVAACEKEVTEEFEKTGKSKYGLTPTIAVGECIAAHAPALFAHIEKNIGKIIAAVDTVGGYSGPIVLLGFYNPNSFILPGSDKLQTALNASVEHELLPALAAGCYGPAFESNGECVSPPITNVKYANPFPVLNKGKEGSAQEKNSICNDTEECNPFDIAVNKEKAEKEGKPFDGEGDIHPSHAGYEAIARLVNAAF